MFAVTNHLAKITSTTNVSEKHGKERVPALSVGLYLVGSGAMIDQFDSALRPMLYRKPQPTPGGLPLEYDDSKTQTRRVVKPQPVYGDVTGSFASWMFRKRGTSGHWLYPNAKSIVISECPHGQIGDRLWVRESLSPTRDEQGHVIDWHYAADGAKVPRMPDLDPLFNDGMAFAHLARMSVPSIHMPRWASRITLEMIGVRVERLHDISEADAQAEGCFAGQYEYDNGEGTESARESFECLWKIINGDDSWDANPWVWVEQFKRA